MTLYVRAFSSTVPVCVCELIIAAQLVFSGWSSRILLRLSPGWDHRAGIVLSCGEPAEMGECPSISSSFFSSLHFLSPFIFCFLHRSLSASSSSVCSYAQSIFTTSGVLLQFLVHLTYSPRTNPPFYHSPTCFPPLLPLVPFSSSIYLSPSPFPPACPLWWIWMKSERFTSICFPPHPIPFLLLYLFPSLAVSPLPPPCLHPSLSLFKLLSIFYLNSDKPKTFESLSWHRQRMGKMWMCVWKDCYFGIYVNHFDSVWCVCICDTMQRGQRCLIVWDWWSKGLWSRSTFIIASDTTAATRIALLK